MYTILPAITKVLETFLESILWKPFQLFCRILKDVSSWIQWKEQAENNWSNVREYGRCSSVVTFFFADKSLTKTDRCAGVIVVKEKSTVGSLFSWEFPSDSNPQGTNNVNVLFFIHSKLINYTNDHSNVTNLIYFHFHKRFIVS
jgi:hypothetical protein